MTGASPSAVFTTDLSVNMTPTTVGIRTTSSLTNCGKRSFSGDVTNYDAYVRASTKLDRTVDTEEVIADYIVYIPHQTLTVSADDEITLSSPVSAVRPILRVDTIRDALGQVGLRIYVGDNR